METVYGIKYTKPKVYLLQDTGIGVSEFAARTCYDSFDASENQAVKNLNHCVENDFVEDETNALNEIEDSELLKDLAWTYFHHSILEHANLSFLIKGTSRGVLQEHARHRIQAISVRSTRYTMSGIINAFACSIADENIAPDINFFVDKILSFDMFVTSDAKYNRVEAEGIFAKLKYQLDVLGREEFLKTAVAKSSLDYINGTEPAEIKFKLLQDGKKKRNVGDAFKHIITDNVKVDMVVTFNLRSLKNYFTLRDSGAAFFQIRWLAQEMMQVTPQKYLGLIDKKFNEKEKSEND